MTEQAISNTNASSIPAYVAALLPATTPEPDPARRINFFVALLIYWLTPKRIGPHLAVGTFKRAWSANIVAVLLTVTVSVLPLILPILLQADIGWLSRLSLHGLRAAAAQAIIETATSSAGPRISTGALVVVCAIPSAEILLVLLAVLLMPWCAGGDSAGSVFKRSLKNVYWSTTCWVVIAAAFAWMTLLDNQKDSWLHTRNYTAGGLFTLFVAGTPLFLWIRALIVGASRYVGPPAGPAFKPREPLCERCGYRLTGLSLTSNCPECAWPVHSSLPGGQRQPTRWQQYPFRPAGILDAFLLQWTILRDRSFFERLPVHEGHAAARHFWWATLFFALLATLLFCWLIVPIVAGIMGMNQDDLLDIKALVSVVGLAGPFLLQTLLGFAACLWAQFRLGIRDYRVSATVCYYASPHMWPSLAIFMIGCLGLAVIGDRAFSRPFRSTFEVLGLELNLLALIGVGLLLFLIVALLLWWLRLLKALRSVRYANV